jgi:YD repeat-containing protein
MRKDADCAPVSWEARPPRTNRQSWHWLSGPLLAAIASLIIVCCQAVNRPTPAPGPTRTLMPPVVLGPTPVATPIPPAVQAPPTATAPVPVATVASGTRVSPRWEYDASGNVVARTDANGAVTRYTYDALNRLTALTYPDGSTVSYTYDNLGRRTEMRDSLGITRYQYDGFGRLLEVADANGNTLKYEYDLADNLTALVYPNGQRVSYQYDTRGRLEKISDAAGTTSYRYNDADQLVDRTLPNGVVTTYGYDSAGRLAGITHTHQSGRILVAFAYTRDAVGNCLQTMQTMADGRKLTTTFAYDEVHRLTQVTHPDGRTVKYRYDPAGNRLEAIAPEEVISYVYDARGNLLRAGATTFTYDANGNRIEMREGDKVTRYRYDYEARLAEGDDGGKVIRFAYDGDGIRLRKSTNGVVSQYVYDLSGFLPELVAEVAADGRWVDYPLAWERLGEIETATGNRFYLTDDIGSVVGLVGEGGELLASYSYDPFGVPLATPARSSRLRAPGLAADWHPDVQGAATGSGSGAAPRIQLTPQPSLLIPSFGFGGEQYDPDTRLLYVGSQYYESSTDRIVDIGGAITRARIKGFGTTLVSLKLVHFARQHVAYVGPGLRAFKHGIIGALKVAKLFGPVVQVAVASGSGDPGEVLDSLIQIGLSSFLVAPGTGGLSIIAPLIWAAYREIYLNDTTYDPFLLKARG